MRSLVLVLCLVVMCGIAGWVFYTKFEYYEQEIDLGYQREAIINPFLAAQRYLERLGKDVEAFDSVQDEHLLENYDTIFLSDSRHILTHARVEQMITWLEAGGHLILAAQAANASGGAADDEPLEITAESSDKLLRRLGFMVFYDWQMYTNDADDPDCNDAECDASISLAEQLEQLNADITRENRRLDGLDELTAAEQIAAREKDIDAELITLIPNFDAEGEFAVYFREDLRIWHPTLREQNEQATDQYTPFFWRGDQYGAHIMQMNVGQGMVTVLSSPRIFESGDIALFDHAYLWEMLCDGAQRIAIFYAARVPSFWQLTLRNAPEILIGFSIVMILWVLRNARRFGPVTPVRTHVRRSLAEHIHASAHFLWRNDQSAVLLARAQERVHHQAIRSIDSYARADAAARIRLLAARVEMDPQQVADCMAPGDTASADAFLEKIQRLQTIGYSL